MASSVASSPASNPSGSILRPPQDLVPVFLAASFHGRRLAALEATGSGCPHRPHAGSTAAAPPWLASELSHAAVQAAPPPPAGTGQELYETESPPGVVSPRAAWSSRVSSRHGR